MKYVLCALLASYSSGAVIIISSLSEGELCGVCRVGDAVSDCGGSIRENIRLRRAHRYLYSTEVLPFKLKVSAVHTCCSASSASKD